MRGKFLHPTGKCLIIYIITQYWTTFEMQKMPVFTKIFNYLAVINFYFIKYSFPYLGFIITAFWFLFLNIKFSTIWLILVLVFIKYSFLIIQFISKSIIIMIFKIIISPKWLVYISWFTYNNFNKIFLTKCIANKIFFKTSNSTIWHVYKLDFT